MKALVILSTLLFTGCAYDGWAVNGEYSHNYFKNKHVEADAGAINTITGPVFDLFGQDNVELRVAAGSQTVGVNDEPDVGALINPRLMWYFAPKSFLQLEYDGTIGLDDNGENHFFFLQWEYRIGGKK